MSDHKTTTRPYGGEIRTGSTDSILASLFRTILFDLGITPNRFNSLLERYIITANIPKNIKEISSLRGNLKKELLKTTMTWKVFIKGLVFLSVKKIDISIRLHHSNNKITEHYKSVTLSYDDDTEEAENE